MTGALGGTPGRRLLPDRALLALLALTAAVPALAVAWAVEDGRTVAVIYREPKLVAFQILGAVLLTALVWAKGRELRLAPGTHLLGDPLVAAVGLWIGYGAVTALWVEVPENLLYELQQTVLLGLLLVALRRWAEVEPAVGERIVLALAGSLGLVTLVGLVQAFIPIPGLVPIDPQFGVPNPSLMGYKNPMALALVGQIHLLAWLALRRRCWDGRPAGRRGRLGWALLLGLELVYLATLQSRTAYLALAVSTLLAAGLWWARSRRGETGPRRLAPRGRAAVLALGALLAAGVFLHPGARGRLVSMGRLLASPASYLETDRGLYLRATWSMVREHPFGVGLGDWQTHYPLHRPQGAFGGPEDTYRVRRAHGDHVQLLGELGWQGLATWWAVLGIALFLCWRDVRRSERLLPLLVGAQVAALTVAMATDYVVELPYSKLQLFLLLVLVPGAPAEPREASPEQRRWRAAGVAIAVVLTAAAAVQIHVSIARLEKCRVAAAMRELHVRVLEDAAVSPKERAPARDALLELGARFEALPGHTKTFFQDHLILAHAAWRSGRRDEALRHLHRARELHPHDPAVLQLAVAIEADGG